MGDACPTSILTEPDNLICHRVVDDLPRDYPIGNAELDAVEAFLMPLIAELLIDDGERISKLPDAGLSDSADSQAPRKAVALRL